MKFGLSVILMVALCVTVHAQTAPQQINYRCKVEKAGVPFDGLGQFKFAIVDQAGTNTYWSNDGTSTGGTEPSNSVALNVKGGLLSVMLGNESYPNMTVVPASVFEQQDRHVRLWFGGKTGVSFERLIPDNPLSSVPYALVAQSVPDDTITGRKLTKESVWPVHEGRDNTIVSYYAEYTGSEKVSLGSIPPNKNYIITDVTYGSVDEANHKATVVVYYTTNAVDTILLKEQGLTAWNTTAGTSYAPTRASFRSGLVVPAGATLTVGGYYGFAWPQGCTISGFEIPVE